MYKYLIFFICNYLFAYSLVSPLPQKVEYDTKKAELGKKLFIDTRLSKDDSISCLTCHNIYYNGAENTKVSTGINNQKGFRNAPTVFNTRYNFVQFWDGRARTLKEQATHPIIDPIEMANTKENLVSTLQKDKEYNLLFNEIYNDGLNIENITDAIAEFEKALVTPNSKFDRYLNGEKHILTQNELEGFELFNKKGCISCHNGRNFGGNMYQKFGVVIFVNDNTDLGRYTLTLRDRDKFLFKVPSLRNIALSAPYFHDGRTDTLAEAVKIMAKRQVGRNITDEEVAKIVDFLNTLTGELPEIVKKDIK